MNDSLPAADLAELDSLLEGSNTLPGALPETLPVGRRPATHVNSSWSGAARNGKLNYSHEAMIDLILTNPGITQGQIAIKFGYTPGWVSNVIASDAFQAMMAKRREEIIDPEVRNSLKELFEGLVRHSLVRLREALEKPDVPANVALRAAELGAKSLGLGGHAPPPVAPVDPNRLVDLANRLVDLNRGRTLDGQASEVPLPSS